jgi:hypothetical protein
MLPNPFLCENQYLTFTMGKSNPKYRATYLCSFKKWPKVNNRRKGEKFTTLVILTQMGPYVPFHITYVHKELQKVAIFLVKKIRAQLCT